MFKQAGKLIAENNDKGLHSDDEEETRPPNNRGQKGLFLVIAMQPLVVVFVN